MQLNQKKLDRQKLVIQRWVANLKITKGGILEATTGFGKTFVAIMLIKDMNIRHPDRTTIVVVPTTKLKNDWEGYWYKDDLGNKLWKPGHIEIHQLKSVQVFVVNTYVKYTKWKCDLLILDEAHHYAGVDAQFFSSVISITEFRFGLGLSATISQKQRDFFTNHGWNIVDTITDEEAEREGYVSLSTTFNLGIELTPADKKYNDDINDKFRYYFSKFNHEFELVCACNIGNSAVLSVRLNNGTNLGKKTGKEWREWWAKRNNWNGDKNHPFSPENITKYAAQGMFLMRKRKDKWQNHPAKLPYIKKILEKFPSLKAVSFSETSEFADQVANIFPKKSVSYHSNLATIAVKGDEVVKVMDAEHRKQLKADGYTIKGKSVLLKEALMLFEDEYSGVNHLVTVKALDEGMDIQKIQLVIQAAYSSTVRQDTQRNGRGKRIDPDNLGKRTIIINLYLKNTQEEKWLKAKQKNTRMIRWVDSVDEISINQTISLNVTEETAVGS